MPIDAAKASEQWLRYMYCRDRGHLPFLEKAERCELFFAGEQWTQTDLAALRLAKRPALTINKIISTLSTVFGEQIFNRSETMYRPKNGSPAETAEALTKVFLHIAQQNQLNWVRSDLFADGCIRSRGFIDLRLDFSDSMRGEAKIMNLNSKNVVVDPDAEEYDPDFWNDVFITKWMTPQDINILYSDEDAKILQDRDGSAYPYGYDSIERVRDRFGGNQLLAGYYGILDPHHVRRNVRVIDRQYRRLDKQEHFVDVKTGDMRAIPSGWDRNRISLLLQKAGGQISTTKKLVKRIRWTVTADTVVLHDAWSPYKHFTVIPYFPHFRYGRTIGLVENLIGSQELLNKTSSQELHVINTTANSGWKLKVGSLQNMSIEELEQKGAQTGLVMELTDVKDAEKIVPNSTPTGLDRVSFKAEEHIKSISGVSDSMQGFDREDVAAKAIQTKRQVGAQNMTKTMDNLERTDFILARNVLDLVQEFYTEERIISITHADPTKQAEMITINKVTPEGEIANDLMIGEFGIIISSQPARDSLEDSQFDQTMMMREKGIQIPDTVIVEASRLQRKGEIIKEMEGDKNSPEAIKTKELKMRMLEAEVATAEAEATEKRAQAEDKLAAARLKTAQATNESSGAEQAAAAEKLRMEQESEAQKMQLEREAHEADLAYQREKLTLEKERMAMELEATRAKAELELKVAKEKAEQDARLREQEAVHKMAMQEKASRETELT